MADSPTSRRPLSFRRSWVPYAQTGNMVVERLSKLALLERSKGKARYRVVCDGVIVALLDSKAEVQGFLQKSKDLEGPHLLRQLSSLPDDSPGHSPATSLGSSPLPSPTHAAEPSAVRQSMTADHAPTSPSAPSPPLAPAARSDSRGGLDHEGLRSRLGSLAKSRRDPAADRPAPAPAPAPPGPQQFLRPPPNPPPGSWLEHALLAPSAMEPEQRTARRRSLVKPPTVDQQPSGNFIQALAFECGGQGGGWTPYVERVRIATAPFAEGAVRQAFRMGVLEDGKEAPYVAKRFTPLMEDSLIRPDPSEPGLNTVLYRSAMLHYASHAPGGAEAARVAEQLLPGDAEMPKGQFMAWFTRLILLCRDVEMQRFCQACADAFNKQHPEKEVRFLPAFLLGMPKKPYDLYFCEPYVDGQFEKYNNNDGDVGPRDAERNTPQAFSHFSYFHSGRQHLIVDIQGFGDVYTDPQVHSNTRPFSLGNLRQAGIDKFFATHRCNNVCVRLGLAPRPVDPAGTK
eukprot:EG_transcript_6258